MKKLYLVAAAALAASSLMLDGCSTTGGLNLGIKPLTPTQQFTLACGTYDLGLQGAVALGQQGLIPKPALDQTILASHQFTPICEQKTPPANMIELTQQLTNAVTSGVLAEGLQYMKKVQAAAPAPAPAPAPVASSVKK